MGHPLAERGTAASMLINAFVFKWLHAILCLPLWTDTWEWQSWWGIGTEDCQSCSDCHFQIKAGQDSVPEKQLGSSCIKGSTQTSSFLHQGRWRFYTGEDTTQTFFSPFWRKHQYIIFWTCLKISCKLLSWIQKRILRPIRNILPKFVCESLIFFRLLSHDNLEGISTMRIYCPKVTPTNYKCPAVNAPFVKCPVVNILKIV